MKNKIAEQARLMSLRASIDDDVSDMLLECSKEIERLQDVVERGWEFITGTKYPPGVNLCGRCGKPLNKNDHCESVKCLGLPVITKKSMPLPEDMLCPDCYRPTNSDGHCIKFACPGKGCEND